MVEPVTFLPRLPRKAPARRAVAAPASGGHSWPDWGHAFAAACNAQAEAERLSYRSTAGEKMLFADLVAHHYLPALSDAAPNTRKNTASHLGDYTGVPTRQGATPNAPYAVRCCSPSVTCR